MNEQEEVIDTQHLLYLWLAIIGLLTLVVFAFFFYPGLREPVQERVVLSDTGRLLLSELGLSALDEGAPQSALRAVLIEKYGASRAYRGTITEMTNDEWVVDLQYFDGDKLDTVLGWEGVA